MRNPLKRQPTADPKPTLRERAASLKATAGRVMGGTKPDPKAVPDAPDARAFAVEQAALIDLSALSIMQLGVLFDRFDAASNTWSAELHLPYADERKCAFRINTAAGDVIEREQERLAEIRDRIAAEIDRRQPAGRWDANTQLETLVRHELMCNGDLRDPAIRARIEATWGDVASAEAERPEPAGDDRSQPGFVLYEDAGGTVRRAPIADWINFMAQRFFSVAKGELDRGFNAACAEEADQDANALYDRLRRDLRVDALFDLAYHSQDIFDANQKYGIGVRRRYEGKDAALTLLGREFDAAHEAWRKTVEANREPNHRFTAFIEAAKARGGPSRAELQAAYALPGVSEANDVEEKAFEAAGELALAILRLPARTLADLAVQARAVIPHVWASGGYEEGGAPDADENIDKEVVRRLIESCCAVAGVDWRGTPVGRAFAVDPAASLVGDILSGWAAWASVEGIAGLKDEDEAVRQVSERRSALIAAADNLPATVASIPAKALALAWIEYVDLCHPEDARPAYARDGRLAFDINQAAVFAASRASDSAPNHWTEQKSPSNFLPSPDFAAMSIRTLDTLHDHASVLSDISNGLVAQPRSKTDDGEHSNEAGTFAVQLAEALGFIVDGCVKEARRRQPNDVSDREIRIRTLARATIENGDVSETRAFARDLLALTEA